MSESIDLYVTVVVLGIMLTVLVGLILYRNGGPFLAEVLGDRDRATGINRLLLVLFLLVVLGVLALISVIDVPWVEDPAQIVLTKLGVVLLRMRTRRRLPNRSREVTVQPTEQDRHYYEAGGSP